MKVKEYKSGVIVSNRAIQKYGAKSNKTLKLHPDESPISQPSAKPAEFGLDLS